MRVDRISDERMKMRANVRVDGRSDERKMVRANVNRKRLLSATRADVRVYGRR